MTFTRIEPWTLLDLANHGVSNHRCSRPTRRSSGKPGSDWTPPVDIFEEDSRFVIRADVPGVEPANIDVSMDGDILSFSGQRGASADGDDVASRRIERLTGRFARHFRLSDAVDTNSISARCDNGILEVVIPKAPDVPARRITVEAA